MRAALLPGDTLSILHLEDDADDAELVAAALTAGGVAARIRHVTDADTFSESLRAGGVDIILADFSGPGFTGAQALEIAHRTSPDIPFVFVSGTLGEESAVDMLRMGATDYVVKERLGRLGLVVRRACAEARQWQERRAVERTLAEQAAVLDRARDAIYILDSQNEIRLWNRGAEEIFGWTRAEAIGSAAQARMYSACKAELERVRAESLERGEWSGDLILETKGGAAVTVESRWTVIPGSREGEAGRLLIMETDVTEKRLFEANVLRAQRLESLGTLAGGIAHDLNNLLAPILMAAEVLLRRAGDDPDRRLLSNIETNARRGADVVRQVLRFARGDAGELTSIHPRQLLSEVEAIVTETFPRHIRLKVRCTPRLPMLRVNRTQMEQLLLNLCVNARDAMPNGGVLTIEIAEAPSEPGDTRRVTIAVRDTGVGIPPAALPRIFDPFFTTKAPGRGTGLGLSTSLRIVQGHGGTIAVRSAEGEGTTFLVSLPASSTVETPRPVATPSLPRGEGQTLLVVDDEEAIRVLTREVLESQGYRVLTAGDGAQALKAFSEHREESTSCSPTSTCRSWGDRLSSPASGGSIRASESWLSAVRRYRRGCGSHRSKYRRS